MSFPISKGAAAWMLVSTVGLGGSMFACEVSADPVTVPPVSPFSGIPDAGLTSTRTRPVACTRIPQENGPCTQVGSICEHGSSPDQQCNAVFVCASDVGSSRNYWTEQSLPRCTLTCPDAAQIVDGAPCDVGDGGDEAELHCTTPAGTCMCTTGRDGAHAHPRRWVCKQPEAGCPAERPMLGKGCVGNWSCDYGSCESKRGMRMICEDDVWQTEITRCE